MGFPLALVNSPASRIEGILPSFCVSCAFWRMNNWPRKSTKDAKDRLYRNDAGMGLFGRHLRPPTQCGQLSVLVFRQPLAANVRVAQSQAFVLQGSLDGFHYSVVRLVAIKP
jgi:hypothetical protein